MRPRAIEVRIGELALEGFSPADALSIGAALQGELARMVREGGLPASLAGGAEREAIDAGSFRRSPQATPAALGSAVAGAVYAGLGRSGGHRP